MIIDWRFSLLFLLLCGVVLLSVSLPLKIWKRTPPGVTPEVVISTLDRIQAHALARAARKAEEKGNLNRALQAWTSAFANDPCDQKTGARYVRALLRSPKSADLQRALQIALWLNSAAPGPASREFVIAAAERNEQWVLVLHFAKASNQLPPRSQLSILRALFRTARFREAKDFIATRFAASAELPIPLYREALECLLRPSATILESRQLQDSLQSGDHRMEAHEIYLVICAEKRAATEFERVLASLKQLTDRTLAFEILHMRLLLQAGRWTAAREVAARFRAPRNARETCEIAEALLLIGDREAALGFLRGYRLGFAGAISHWILYGQLLLERANPDELRTFRQELLQQPSSPPSDILVQSITCLLEPSAENLKVLNSALATASSADSAGAYYFAADALVKADRSELACKVLTRIEASHLHDPDFYARLFAAAEANRDAALMRRVAERRYHLAPGDQSAVANHAAMLVMCEDDSNEAVALAALCLKTAPASVAAKVNYAAALINSDDFGAADLILREINESSLAPEARNQLHFIKLKRAFKLRHSSEVNRLAALLDKSALYSVQIGWLSQNRI